MNIAAKVAANKLAHPERYCSHPKCLWRVETRNGRTPCPRHQVSDEDFIKAQVHKAVAAIKPTIVPPPSRNAVLDWLKEHA